MKKLLVVLALALFGVSIKAADFGVRTNAPDGSRSYLQNFRDMGNSTNSPTVQCEQAYDWNNVVGATETVKSTAGLLHTITVNTAANVAFVVYDSNAVTDTTRPIASFKASVAEQTFVFDVKVSSGIQINCAGSGPDITVSYR